MLPCFLCSRSFLFPWSSSFFGMVIPYFASAILFSLLECSFLCAGFSFLHPGYFFIFLVLFFDFFVPVFFLVVHIPVKAILFSSDYFVFSVLILRFSIMVDLFFVLVCYVLLVVFLSLVALVCHSQSWPFLCSSFFIPFFFLTSPFLRLGYSFLHSGCSFLHSMSLAVLAVRYWDCVHPNFLFPVLTISLHPGTYLFLSLSWLFSFWLFHSLF